jgi:signal transduction histidine kinase
VVRGAPALAPLAAGLLGLAGALGATLFLHRAAAAALDRVQEERLRGAGETATRLLTSGPPGQAVLRDVMAANGLEGAYVLSPSLTVVADAAGAGGPADLLRIDAVRAQRAFAGDRSTAFGYSVGEVPVATGYFPLRDRDGAVRSVLVLEGGASFAAARLGLRRALFAAEGLSALVALALAGAALQWSRAEARQRRSAEQAARGEALSRMSAMVAHEIRNPLGVIRGAVELVGARAGPALSPRDREALSDVLGEVERLRHLTEDLLDLSREPALDLARVDLSEIAAAAARSAGASHPGLAVRLELPQLPVMADRRRLTQVLLNLLLNAAQAGARSAAITGEGRQGAEVRLKVRDDGPGVPPALRPRLFQPFATGRPGGTGLGLAICRRLVERHGGTLRLLDQGGPGAAFELRLPRADG